jgi:hypothetical protein
VVPKEQPDAVEERLHKLESMARTVVIAFPSGTAQPLIVPEHIIARRNDVIRWQILMVPGIQLDHVTIEFEPDQHYFPGEPQKHKKRIQGHSGPMVIEGKVPLGGLARVDKYTVRWQIIGQSERYIDPTIIVTDP